MKKSVITGLFCLLSFMGYPQKEGKYDLGNQLEPLLGSFENVNYQPSSQVLESNCENSNFSFGNWTNWQGCYGYHSNSCWFSGFKTTSPNALHVIIPGPGYLDPNTCDSLLNVFPGESFVAKLGDTLETNPSIKAAELKYQVTVTSDSYLFIYRYAIVLQSGGHDIGAQPDFKVMVTDSAGQVLDSTCGYYYFEAQKEGPPRAGWHLCGFNVYWKDWTTTGMDLSSYLGQTIYIVFKVRPCSWDTHFGYAYISAYCNQLEIQTALCEGQDSAVLTAPPGFSYYWLAITGDPSINGATTASITVPAVEGAVYQCTLTALNGCTVTITNTLYYTQIHTGYTQNLDCAQRLSKFTDTSWVSQNDVIAWRWFFGDPASKEDDSSHLKNPTHTFIAPGNYNVTLISYSTEGCSDTITKQITIDSLPDVSNTTHYKILCNHDSTDIVLTSNVSGTLFTWTATSTSLLITGYSDQTTPVFYLNQHLINNGNEIDTVIYNVIPQNGICTGEDTTFVIAVYPTPIFSNQELVKSICDSSFTNIILLSNFDTTRFTWTCTANSPNITGYSENTTTPDTLINQLLLNSGYNIDTVYYHIVPLITVCPGDTSIYKVAVYPIPDLANADRTDTICDSSFTNIILTSHVTGTLFTWRAFGSSPLVTGYSNSTTPGILIDQQLENIGFVYQTVTYRLLPSANGCIGDSVDYFVTVNPGDSVEISIAASANNVCTGTLVTFTATPLHGGTNPFYQWKVNGVNVGTNNPVYNYIPANSDLVWCVLTSSETCISNNPASSIQHQMVVNPLLPVSVTISASSNPFCIANSVTFTATHSNGGSSPSWQWKVNGANMSIDSLYTYYPVNGDMVSCVFTSSASCVTGNPATSNTITMTGTTGLPAGVSINAIPNPFCPGSSVTCTATPGNGGTNPVYQWNVNGINVGINSPTYIFNPLNNDSVRCVMTSNLSCVSWNPATSNKIILSGTLAPIVTFTRCFDSITRINAKPIKLKGGIPLGGTYSGPGVNSTTGVFTPSVAGIGTKIITYSYTNVALCSASKTKTIIVQSASAFICGNNLTDIRDGKVYPTLKIGSQCWMASNLNYGNRIPSTGHQRDNCTPEKYCYNELTANCEQRGANYQWDEMMQYEDIPGLKGLCPPGWHIPSETEWQTLFSNWTNNASAGAPLKYSGYSGFNALMSGVRHLNVQWDYQNLATFFWSSTPYGAYKAWAYGMNDYDPSVAAYPSSRANAFSIRCTKD